MGFASVRTAATYSCNVQLYFLIFNNSPFVLTLLSSEMGPLCGHYVQG